MAGGKGRLILVAVDDSDFSLHALQFACENIVAPNDALTIAHVRPEVEEKDFFAAEPYRAEFEEAYLRDSNAILEKMKRLAQSILPSETEVNTLSLAGDPSQELHRAEERLKPELMIVGSHGKGLLKRALLGSVSRYLVHNCTCPVLVVKTPGKSDTAASLIPGMDQLGNIVQSAS